jgi:hypothetical protein
MRNLNYLYLSAFLVILGFGCSEQPTVSPQPSPLKKDTLIAENISIPIDSNLTRCALLIAGMDSTTNYPHPKWNNASLAKFVKETAAKYSNMRENRLEKMSMWQNSNMKRAQLSDSAFAFYPFSGGDFIHLHWLMPNAKEYFMVAREEVGSLPNLMDAADTVLRNYLKDVDLVLRDIYSKSYFITKSMITDIHNDNRVDGMLPILVWAAAKTGHEIISIDFFNVDSLGNSVSASAGIHQGVTIRLKDVARNQEKKLTYLSADISDKGFQNHPEIKRYLSDGIPSSSNTFVKSASYLMHYEIFQEIRNFVLERSTSIVQDDTGIPFKYFDQTNWRINLFGNYEKPVKDFSENLFQKDLNLAYQDSTFYQGELNFSLGYHWGSGNQNQMFTYKLAR